jgi:NDP-sugar pyrophosphorylase family protein
MLHVGGRPIAERLLENLLESGITDVFMSLHYLPHVVRSHFAGGESFGARVNYLEEATPLGTAGCLSLLPRDIDRPVIMVNGDVVTDARLGRVLDFHTAADHDVTVCVRPYVVPIPFGVVDQCNGVVTGIREKPQLVYSVNVAIYVLSPRVLAKVPANARLDMPTFIESLIRDGDRVGAFPLVENWIDVGTPAELERARHEFRNTAVSQSQLACA